MGGVWFMVGWFHIVMLIVIPLALWLNGSIPLVKKARKVKPIHPIPDAEEKVKEPSKDPISDAEEIASVQSRSFRSLIGRKRGRRSNPRLYPDY